MHKLIYKKENNTPARTMSPEQSSKNHKNHKS